jgi:hypothetical protein
MARVDLRIPDALKAALTKAAAKNIRSLNGEIEARLQESLKK